jgi:spermidine synthase
MPTSGPELAPISTIHPEVDLRVMRWYFVFFVVSGFCGLVYEVVWLRLAMASFGVTTAMVSIVVSTFMAGLGAGSWGAGVLVRRTADGHRALRMYALAELLVGCSSFLVPPELRLGRLLLQNTAGLAAWQSLRYYELAGCWIALTLIPWCVCMGATFPLLMSDIRQTATLRSERSFSFLYVANVMGALLGVLISAFFLIECMGFQRTLYVAGVLNGVLACLAFRLSSGARSVVPTPQSGSERERGRGLYGFRANGILAMLFTTGLVSMGMEVIWIRQLTPYLGNVVYAFAGILATYLFSTLVGSQDYRSWASSHKLAESAPSWTLLALFALIPLLGADPLIPLRLGTFELSGIRLAGIVLFCALAGFLTPLLVDSWSSGDPDRAGTAYAVNVLGSILGPLVAGFWLLPRLGERWALVALSIPLFVLALFTTFVAKGVPSSRFKPKLKFVLASLMAVLIVRVTHDYEKRFTEREVKRDYTATVIATGKGFESNLVVNGIGMTSLTPITKYMAHLPLALMSRQPENGLVICFGMGTTFRSMLSWGIPTVAVDLVPSVPSMFGYFHSDAQQVTSSPLARVVIDDGRRFLDGSEQSYDIIVVDPPPPPEATGSSLLYSREFLSLAKKHLSTDGILQVWYPAADGDPATIASIAKAAQEVFPFVRAFRSFNGSGIHFLASKRPLQIPSSQILASRLPASATADLLEWGPGSTGQTQFQAVISQELNVDSMIARDLRVPALSDDQPINEYYLLRSWLKAYR